MSSTKDCFDRLAKCGVEIPGIAQHGLLIEVDTSHDGWVPLDDDHAELLLEAAVLRVYPYWTCMTLPDGWFVWDTEDDDATLPIASAPTRLAALTLAAERVEKEKAQ